MVEEESLRSRLLDIFLRLCTLFGSLWLIGDQVSDIFNAKSYHELAMERNGNVRFYDSEFLYLHQEGGKIVSSLNESFSQKSLPSLENNIVFANKVLFKEACFFYASAGALMLPIPVGIILVFSFLIYDYSSNLRRWPNDCCSNECCGKCCGIFTPVLSLPFTCIVSIIFSVLLVPIAWIFSPFLHIARALFALFGAKPVGNNSPIQSKSFKRFWTFVLLLGIMEQVLEALPQTIISALYFYLEQEPVLYSKPLADIFWHLYENHKTQVISLIFSAGSLLLCMIVNIFRYTHDRPNSFLGLINNLDFPTLKKKSSQKEHISKHLTDEENIELLPRKPILMLETKAKDCSEVIDGGQEQWMNAKINNEVIRNEAKDINYTSASLCIRGLDSTTEQIPFARFLSLNGVPQDVAFLARFSTVDSVCFIDNLKVNDCDKFIVKLNCLHYEGKKLVCTGTILDSRCTASHRVSSQEGSIGRRLDEEMYQLEGSTSKLNEEVQTDSSEEDIEQLEAELITLLPTIRVKDQKVSKVETLENPKRSNIENVKEALAPQKTGWTYKHELKKTTVANESQKDKKESLKSKILFMETKEMTKIIKEDNSEKDMDEGANQ